jgi:hypothetical protein
MRAARSHHIRFLRNLLLIMLSVAPALAADVTPDRLINADKEPQNWLMNHQTVLRPGFETPG